MSRPSATLAWHRGAAALLLPALLALGCIDQTRRSSVIEMKVGHGSPPGSLIAVAAEEFVRRVNDELAGRVHVSLFGGGQLGSDEVTLIKAKLGTVDFTVSSTVVSSTVEAFGFFELPYLIRDRAHLRRIEDEVFWPHISPFAEERGLKVLALWEHGFRQITNNVRPIVVPEDLGGIKLRTPTGFWRIAAFQAFGAHPTPMPLTEVFVALQTGVLDGQENPLNQIHASRFQEVQRYLSLTNHVYSPVFVTVGLRKWETQPQEIRSAITRIARDVAAYSHLQAERLDRELAAQFARSGMEVNEIDSAKFIEASWPVYQRFATAIADGQRWVDIALALGETGAAGEVPPGSRTVQPVGGQSR